MNPVEDPAGRGTCERLPNRGKKLVNRQTIDGVMAKAFSKVAGLVKTSLLPKDDHQKILDVEQEAEKNAFMGFGNVINAGVREVLTCKLIYVALTDMDFDWGCQPSLVL